MKISYLLTTFLLLNILAFYDAEAQLLTPLGNGVINKIEATCVHENNVYVVYESQKLSMDSINFRVSKWNGYYWQHLPEFTVIFNSSTISYNILSLVVFKNELYVAGNFPGVEGVANSSNIIRYDGLQWKDVGGGIMPVNHWYFVRDMVVFNDELFVSGLFNLAGSKQVNNIAKWDGVVWNKLSDGLNNLILDVEIYNDQLFATGIFDSSGTIRTGSLSNWDGVKWNRVANSFLTISEIKTVNKELFVFGDSHNDSIVQKWDGSSWSGNVFNLDVNSTVYSFAEINGELWAATYAKINGTYYNLIKWEKNQWNPLIKSSQYYNINQVTNAFGQLHLSGDFDTIGSFILNNIAKFNITSGRISGTVYYDQNKNCIQDGNEKGLSERMIEIQPGDIFVSTDNNGNYEYNLEPGSYVVKHNFPGYQINSCNSDSFIVEIIQNSIYTNLDFASSNNIANKYNLSVSLSGHCGWRARFGFIEQFTIKYENLGDILIPSGTIILTHDENLEFTSSQPIADNYVKPLISWHFNNLLPGEKRFIRLSLKIPLNIQDILVNTCFGIPLIGDIDSLNNFDTLIQNPVGALDPNDKQCWPSGHIKPETNQIDYTIRFQNTGTDTAYRVTVIDTIDVEHLPIKEVLINTVSHPFKLSINKNVLTWTFNLIMLPDSHANAKESQGFIRYAARLKTGIAAGDTIENRAYIYFDYQQAVPTNKTINIIDTTVGIQLPKTKLSKFITVYPNPAIEKISIENRSPSSQKLEIVNLLGITVNEIHVSGLSTLEIKISDLSAGVYFIISHNQDIKEKILIIR